MFGFFKKKDDHNVVKLRNEFDLMVQQIKPLETLKQGLVGRGIQAAEESFRKTYSTESFQAAPFSEQMKQISFIRGMEVQINKMDGPVRVTSIGYALFNRWLGAVMSSDANLVQHFEKELLHFKNIANSLRNTTD